MKNKNLDRVLKILNFISKNPQGATFIEIVNELDIPKSTIHDILKVLHETDCIYYKDESLKRYSIGSTIFTLAQSYSKSSTLINASKYYISEVCAEINQPIMISKFVIDKVVYVHKDEPVDSILKTPNLGVCDKGINSSVGKLFVAFSNLYPDRLEELGIDDKCYIDELKKIRDNNYEIGINVEGKNIITICVPVYNFENRVCGVVSTIGIYIPTQNYDYELEKLTIMANKISEKLGYNNSNFN